MTLLTNPVLPGFSPDPSLIRVDDWFYLANSSFEWYPAIPIHRSRDLITWEYAGSFSGLNASLELRGLQDSGGVWAPSLSWADGDFWLVFTVVRGFGGPHKDMDTYVSRAREAAGPWSAPTRVTTTGFDPSIFHHDGRHWLVNMEWDHRPTGRGGFAGINLQELNPTGTATVGEPTTIHRRPELIEGPNLYYFENRFYLMLAEGGTGRNHGIAMMRSDTLHGPYTEDPQGPVLTTRDVPSHPLQKAGHGEIAADQDGTLFLAHLASRWMERDGRQYSILGRETCIQRLAPNGDGWLRLEQGGRQPAVSVVAASTTAAPTAGGTADAGAVPAPDGTREEYPGRDISFGGFSAAQDPAAEGRLTVGWPWNTLRQPARSDWASLEARPGWLRLRGRHSTDSLHEQSLVARRITAPAVTVCVTVDASPANYTQSAGLVFYYNTDSYCYLRTTVREIDGDLVPGDAALEQILEVFEKDPLTGLQSHGTAVVDSWLPLRLEGSLEGETLQFYWSQDGDPVKPIGPTLNALALSDDYGGALRFTGTLVGVAAQDLRDRTFTADFTDFSFETG